MNTRRIITFTTLAIISVVAAYPALAQTATWMTPAQTGVTSLTTTLVTMGGGLIGLSIVGFGLWAALTHRINWPTLWIFFISGMLVTVGPAAITWFISLLQGSGGTTGVSATGITL